MCIDLLRCRITIVHGSSQGGPNGPLWGGGGGGGNRLGRRPYVKSSCFIYFLKMLPWSDFNQTWQESSFGAGDSKSFIWYMWPPWGPRERAPKGQNHANFKVTSSDPEVHVEQSSYVVFKYLLM